MLVTMDFLLFLSLFSCGTASLLGPLRMRTYRKELKQVVPLTTVWVKNRFDCAYACNDQSTCDAYHHVMGSCELFKTGCGPGIPSMRTVYYAQPESTFKALAVYLAYNNDLPGYTEPIPFDDVRVDASQSYDVNTNQVIIPWDGLYIVSIQASGARYRLVENGIKGTWVIPQINLTTSGPSVNGWSEIKTYQQGDAITVSGEDACTGCVVYLVIASLEDIRISASPTFVAKRTGGIPATPSSATIDYDHTIMNLGGAFDGTVFTAPVAGDYIVLMSVGCVGQLGLRQTAWIMLRVNGIRVYSMRCESDLINYQTYQVGGSAVVTLAAGDVLDTIVINMNIPLLDTGYNMSFSAFLYEPQGCSPSSWVMVRHGNILDTGAGGLATIPLVQTRPEEGITWAADKLTCQHSGLYLIFLSARKYSDVLLQIAVVKDGLEVTAVTDNTAAQTTYMSSSVTMLVYCAAGQQMWLSAAPFSSVYSYGPTYSLYFSGFLLQPL